jgi:hypothetical protein
MTKDRELDRRRFLKIAAGSAAAAMVAPAFRPAFGKMAAVAPAGPAGAIAYKTGRVVVIAFAGGVRSRDTIKTPGNVPNLMRIAKEGVVFPNTCVKNVGHFGATLSIFTGLFEYLGIRDNERGENPTIFEYVRKQKGLAAKDVWFSATGGAQAVNLSHRSYGEKYGANLISSDGIFNAEFREILESYGRPKPPSEEEGALLTKLRQTMATGLKERGAQVKAELNDPTTLRSIEKFVIEEISRDTSNITGPGSGDAKTIRIAASLFRGFRPALLGIAVSNADVAHNSYNSYVEVIRRNDEETTSVFILPEFGRNRDLNERNGLDHGDGSPDLMKVGLICAGPDFKKNKTVLTDIESIDVAPTVSELFGVKAELSKGKLLREAFA